MEAIKEAVWSYLPGLPDDLLTTILDELGVESIEDLALMEEKDLVRYLKPIQCRKLMNGIKKGKFIFWLTWHLELGPWNIGTTGRQLGP